jgi:RNA polymerase sigma factor (sigma-70 family)
VTTVARCKPCTRLPPSPFRVTAPGVTSARGHAANAAGRDWRSQLTTIRIYRWGAIGRYCWQERPCVAWLYRLAHNVYVDHLRRQRVTMSLNDESRRIEVSSKAAAAELAQGVDADLLARAMTCLTDEQRDVLLLKFFDGLGTEEMARIMGKRKRAMRALHSCSGSIQRDIASARCEAQARVRHGRRRKGQIAVPNAPAHSNADRSATSNKPTGADRIAGKHTADARLLARRMLTGPLGSTETFLVGKGTPGPFERWRQNG